MRTETEQTIFLKDYAPAPYVIEKVELEVDIVPDQSSVKALLTVVPRETTAPGTPLSLDGDELKLVSIAIDGAPLAVAAYAATEDNLVIAEPPLRRFVLETVVTIEPEKNTRLMGLYRSNGTWCTQCEPEGFRRITYFLDRPDNLAVYTVRMIADKAQAPVLLANGNLVETGEIGDKHFAVWEDPFPKPSYLFAMVAGDLGHIEDHFTTASGRDVKLGIYSAHGKQDQCLWAMDCLKRSMAWDERRFGREYDLDIFNIVAVSDFNFGAMENKGLNIFNDKLVFASPETATDADYENVERVISHEYFHNWTGNRITCRDWFQLCLKEGLTVYRDQEFTSDERSRAVKRIDDVRTLRSAQFPEDASPLAHPPRPDRYREINNFYTTTVYEKGAEIVRMLATYLGQEGFRKGMDLYFERHDGEAATIEQFLAAFADANGVDLEHFKQWYLQAGTPEVSVSERYDADSQTYTLSLSQVTRPTPNQPDKQPMVLPIKFGLIGPNGAATGWNGVSGAEVRDDMIILDKGEAEVTFRGVANRPVPSLFRGFSAPVKIATSLSLEDQLFLARHDTDPFNRWQSLQDAAMALMVEAVKGRSWSADAVSALAIALGDTITSDSLDPAFKALALSLPTETLVARTIGENVDPDKIRLVRLGLLHAIGVQIADVLERTYEGNLVDEPYRPSAEQAGRRALRNTALSLMVTANIEGAAGLARTQYETAANMTDRFAALSAVSSAWTPDAQALLDNFRAHYTADPLVYDKWLSLNAVTPVDGVIDRIRAILADPTFPINNPNRLRALMASFGMNNPTQFARADGAGFRLVTEFCADVDKRNPQVAARVLTAFRVWKSYEPGRRAEAEKALLALENMGPLSRNTADILTRTLDRATA